MSKENISLQVISNTEFDTDRRRAKRIELQIPLFVRQRESRDDQPMELAKTIDISSIGAFIVCPLSIRLGHTVTLTIPVPSITTSALVPAAMQPIQAKVTRRQESGDAQWIGVEFLTPLG
ncbi:MAG TPA: PilZ domain-containing protein [Candidatus Acidoferrales bacterium]|jgi:hypothetical protein|nr:PilZ domain-containing protein [Candidatus Acidoferrales bacterium]